MQKVISMILFIFFLISIFKESNDTQQKERDYDSKEFEIASYFLFVYVFSPHFYGDIIFFSLYTSF